MLRLLLPSLLLLACGGQSAIIATVVDDEGAPVPKAEVGTEPATSLVQTNPRGLFRLAGVLDEEGNLTPLPEGAFKLQVAKIGHQHVVRARSGRRQLAGVDQLQRAVERAPDGIRVGGGVLAGGDEGRLVFGGAAKEEPCGEGQTAWESRHRRVA